MLIVFNHRVNPSNANIQYNDLLIRERHEDILALSTEMNQVQTVFKDLAEMIADQGEMIEDIESNVTSAAEQSKQGVRQIMVISLFLSWLNRKQRLHNVHLVGNAGLFW